MAASALEDLGRLSESDLAAGIARNDVRAVRQVTQANNQRLFRVAWSILRNKSEAEDAVQESYLRGFAAIGSFHGQSSLSTWLTRIAINEALGRKRQAGRRAAFLAENSVAVLDTYREKLMGRPSATPEADIMHKQLAKVLEDAVAQLPDTFRTVFVLREIEGLSISETAELLEIPEETVKTRFHRARIRLRRMLDPELKSALDETVTFAGADCARLTAKVLQRLGHEPNMEEDAS
ncbi:MAG TPA: RNA polymerase sigma factor [Rhizomicrobium sp.]